VRLRDQGIQVFKVKNGRILEKPSPLVAYQVNQGNRTEFKGYSRVSRETTEIQVKKDAFTGTTGTLLAYFLQVDQGIKRGRVQGSKRTGDQGYSMGCNLVRLYWCAIGRTEGRFKQVISIFQAFAVPGLCYRWRYWWDCDGSAEPWNRHSIRGFLPLGGCYIGLHSCVDKAVS